MPAFIDSPSKLADPGCRAELAPTSVVRLRSAAQVQAWLAKRAGAPSSQPGVAET